MSNNRPNILFFFPDQFRYDWLGMHPDIPVRTPNFEKLGARGVRFTHAVTPSPLCAPARACLAAGKEYARCRVPQNNVDYPLDQTTVYTLLRQSGYHVLGCGKFDLNKGSQDWGLDGKTLLKEWGLSDGINNEGKMDGIRPLFTGDRKPKGPYLAYLAERGLASTHAHDLYHRYYRSAVTNGFWASTYPTPLPEDAYCDNWIAQKGLDLLDASPGSRPWFLQVNFTGPHQPLDITEAMKTWYADTDFPQPIDAEPRSQPYPPWGSAYHDYVKESYKHPHLPGKPHTPQQHNEVRQNYSAMVENIDRWLGIYMDRLEQRGEIDNTLIVFASDHGDMLGDHGYWEKHRPYQSSIGVPLLVSGPGVETGRVIGTPNTIMDLTATFLEYGGLPVPEDMDSRSLKPRLEGKTDRRREYVTSAWGDWRLVYDGRYKFVRGYGAEPILFDLEEDPFEIQNVYRSMDKQAARLAELL